MLRERLTNGLVESVSRTRRPACLTSRDDGTVCFGRPSNCCDATDVGPAQTPPDPVCHDAPASSGHSSIADQEAADAAYDRVRHAIQTLHLTGYSSGYVVLKARQAHIYWVGPVPAVLLQLPPGRDHGTVVFQSAPYTSDQLRAAIEHVNGARLSATDPSGYVISSADECVDGTGIRVHVADPAHGDTLLKVIPPSLIATIKTLAGEMPAVVVGGYAVHGV